MASSLPTTTISRQRLAEGFWRAAMVSLVVMPLGMAIAHRSSPLFIVLSAVLCLLAARLEGRARSFWSDVSSALTAPLGIAVLAFFGWCLISIGWSEFKIVSIRAFGEFWLPIAASVVLALTLPQRLTPRMFGFLVGTFTLAGLIIIVELQTGMILRKTLGVRSDPYIFNRPVLTLLMLALPLTAWLLSTKRNGGVYGLLLLLFLGAVAIQSESDAAVLALAIVCLVFPIAWLAPRLTFVLAVAAFLAAVSLSPLIGALSAKFMTPEMHRMLATGHSKERVELWQSFGAVVREEPLLGTGFGVSPRMPDTKVAAKVPVEHQPMLNIGHPHNAVLQIWVELGAVGALLFLVIAFLSLRAIWHLPHLIRSASLALLAGIVPVSLVGHGAWQGWWAASLGAALIWMQAVRRIQTETTQ
ncbi:O-antigen ligase family protein [Microvirga guangxiensis]|uniref:O-antigen ligase n=1 Tax=Microvirga guangxiensis TaxID=549386 RepID=A0A1G5BX08_9HYPH|nr:O-antigen ligase family protein [Microvirga guangxiensis]SCX94799.1 O-antigen ligase [Microvirga guangxiensis]